MKIYQRDETKLQNAHSEDVKEKEERGNGVNVHFLQQGKTLVRILPPYSDAGVWYRHIKEHTLRIGGKFQTFTCSVPYGGVCPICVQGQALYHQDTPESINEAKQFRPANKFLYNALILSSPKGVSLKDGVHVLKSGVLVKQDLLDLDTDVQTGWGNITDLSAGVNVSIDRVGSGLETKYHVKGFAQRTDIMATCQEQGVDFSTFELYNLDTLFPPRSEEELQAALEGRATAPGFSPPQPVEAAPVAMPVAAPVAAPQPLPVVACQSGLPAPATTAPVATPVVAAPVAGPIVVGAPVPVPVVPVPAPPKTEDE